MASKEQCWHQADAAVIQSAIRQKKNVVTTSYVSPQMLELDEACKKAGIVVMNEIGLGMSHNWFKKRLDFTDSLFSSRQ